MFEDKKDNKSLKVKKGIKGKDVVILPFIFIGVMIFGLLGFLIMQKLAVNNRHICTYLGRLWMPDKDISEPGFYKCYTYEEYYR